jgi:hypothetical protein
VLFMGKSVRNLVWLTSVGMFFTVGGWLTWLYFDTKFFHSRAWVEPPSAQDMCQFAVVIVAWLGVAVSSRPLATRWVYTVFCVAVTIAIAIFFVGNWVAELASQRSASLTWIVEQKPNTSRVVLGYHWLTAEAGGQVAFGDGSVGYLTKDEFLASLKAEPPDYEPRFISPRKSHPSVQDGAQPENPNNTPRPTDPAGIVREAEERARIGTFLKRLAVAHFALISRADGRPPLDPSELQAEARLNEKELAELTDGTYVWSFGWQPYIKPKYTMAQVQQSLKLSWLSLHAFVASLGFLLYASVMLVRGRSSPRQNRVSVS